MIVTSLPHEFVPAVNFNDRIGVDCLDILLMHYTGVPSEEFALEILTNGEREVSCHYMVREDGRIVQMVSEDKRAWHAGKSSWEGSSDVNSRSIGIEICNPGHGDDYHDFPAEQIEAVIALSKDIIARHTIQPSRVLAHSDVAPGRKIDPGEKFPWKLLAGSGIGFWPHIMPVNGPSMFDPGTIDDAVLHLQQCLKTYGYDINMTGEYDDWTQTVVRSFQMHFRPDQCDGLADAETFAIIDALATGLSV